MWKQNKWKIILSSIITILPMLFGVIVWDKLPAQMSTHWGINGAVDGKSGSAYAVFLLPLILLGVYWLCLWVTTFDPKNKNQNKKAMNLIFWIVPVISLFSNGVIYATAFGMELDVIRLMPLLLGLMFVFIGNYMPKCTQNFSLGIKIKWTLENEENWNATHRFAGKVWVLGGLVLLLCTFLPVKLLMYISLLALMPIVFIPVIYSYIYYRKQLRAGTYHAGEVVEETWQKNSKKVAFIVIPLILIFAGVIMFTGKVDVTYEKDTFTVDASFWNELTVEYNAIDSMEFRENFDRGVRTNGVGSAKLLAGAFENDEFDNYTLYSYLKCKAAVILKVDDKILVINGKDIESTKAIYQELSNRHKEK